MVYFVTGIGRCGTSAVAGVMHNKMDINMGTQFVEADKNNSNGYWEDKEFVDVHNSFLKRNMNYTMFSSMINQLIKDRQSKHTNWGIKDPKLCYFLGNYLNYISDYMIVYCYIDREQNIQNLFRTYGWRRSTAESMYIEREMMFKNIFKSINRPIISIDLTNRLSDDEIKEKLQCLQT